MKTPWYGLIVVALALPVVAAEEAPELVLQPCTVELVDGTEVRGKLAAQFDLDDHVIVYSPRLATVRSFLKDHVHALTVDGKREELNPKRDLTDEDRKLLGRVEWPDEPPAEGIKPAYTTETWDKPKRLVVWARPGRSGRFGDPGNWLENGRPMKSLAKTEVWSGPAWGRSKGVADLDADTDLVIPAAARSYQVRGRGGAYIARHITVEGNAFFGHGIKGAYGNLWVASGGRLDGGGHAALRGTKHTFFVNGERRDPDEPVDWETIEAKGFARKWVIRKDARDASMELIGSIGSGDETHVIRGRAVVSEYTTVLIGPRCCQSVRREGVLQLTSGAVVAKNGNQLHKQDMMIVGTLLAGTPERPLESDCYIGISFKDHETLFAGRMWTEVGKRVDFRGFEVVPTGRIHVHSADPTEAQLVFCCHQQDGAGDSGNLPNSEREPEKWAAYEELPRRINLVFWKGADVQFDGVVFRDIEAGGIKLQDMSMKDSWRHVYFGENNAGPAEELYQEYEPTMEGRGAYSYPIETAAKGEEYTSHGLFTKNPGTPIIETPGGWYAEGETVRVRLSSEMKELEIRYTLNGDDPTASSTLYEAPFVITEDTVVKVGAFKDGKQYGDTVRAEFKFVSPEEVERRGSADTGSTSAGLAYKYYEGKWKELPDFDKLTPARTGTAKDLDPNAIRKGDGFAILYEGFIEIPEPGIYTFYVATAKEDACRVEIGGQTVIENDLRDLHGQGLLGLEAGKHPLEVSFADGGWRQQLRLSYRKLGDTKKRDVTPEMLSH